MSANMVVGPTCRNPRSRNAFANATDSHGCSAILRSTSCRVPGARKVMTLPAHLAGINAKGAICLRLTGRIAKSDDHRSAVPELASAGPVGKALQTTFRQLLDLKATAQ